MPVPIPVVKSAPSPHKVVRQPTNKVPLLQSKAGLTTHTSTTPTPRSRPSFLKMMTMLEPDDEDDLGVRASCVLDETFDSKPDARVTHATSADAALDTIGAICSPRVNASSSSTKRPAPAQARRRPRAKRPAPLILIDGFMCSASAASSCSLPGGASEADQDEDADEQGEAEVFPQLPREPENRLISFEEELTRGAKTRHAQQQQQQQRKQSHSHSRVTDVKKHRKQHKRTPRRILEPPFLGPVSSVHDRACEVFWSLRGANSHEEFDMPYSLSTAPSTGRCESRRSKLTRVDYGAEHSARCGHARFGRVVGRGLLHEWGWGREWERALAKSRQGGATLAARDVKVQGMHLLGYSLGGVTVYKLQQLLREGFFDDALGITALEREQGLRDPCRRHAVYPRPPSDPSPAVRLIRSVTTVSAPLRGTPLVYLLGQEPLPIPRVRQFSIGDWITKAVHVALFIERGLLPRWLREKVLLDVVADAWHFTPPEVIAQRGRPRGVLQADEDDEDDSHGLSRSDPAHPHHPARWSWRNAFGLPILLQQLRRSDWASGADSGPWDCTLFERMRMEGVYKTSNEDQDVDRALELCKVTDAHSRVDPLEEVEGLNASGRPWSWGLQESTPGGEQTYYCSISAYLTEPSNGSDASASSPSSPVIGHDDEASDAAASLGAFHHKAAKPDGAPWPTPIALAANKLGRYDYTKCSPAPPFLSDRAPDTGRSFSPTPALDGPASETQALALKVPASRPLRRSDSGYKGPVSRSTGRIRFAQDLSSDSEGGEGGGGGEEDAAARWSAFLSASAAATAEPTTPTWPSSPAPECLTAPLSPTPSSLPSPTREHFSLGGMSTASFSPSPPLRQGRKWPQAPAPCMRADAGVEASRAQLGPAGAQAHPPPHPEGAAHRDWPSDSGTGTGTPRPAAPKGLEAWYANDGVVPLASQFHPGECHPLRCSHAFGLPAIGGGGGGGASSSSPEDKDKDNNEEEASAALAGQKSPLARLVDTLRMLCGLSALLLVSHWLATLPAALGRCVGVGAGRRRKTDATHAPSSSHTNTHSGSGRSRSRSSSTSTSTSMSSSSHTLSDSDSSRYTSFSSSSVSSYSAVSSRSTSPAPLPSAARTFLAVPKAPNDPPSTPGPTATPFPAPKPNHYHTFSLPHTSHGSLCPLWLGTDAQRDFWRFLGAWLEEVDEEVEGAVAGEVRGHARGRMGRA